MTESFRTRVENPGGPTHTGSGNIYINADSRPHGSSGSAFRGIAEDQLRWHRRVLVPPVNLGQARSLLADTGTVILDGPPGSGRSCAARVLLREHHQDTGALHELQPDEEEELPLHDPDLVGAGDQLLLDLSTADDAQWARACKDLPALRKTVHDQQAHLVVVMPHDRPLDSDLQHYRVVVSAPGALTVLHRHLRVHGLPYGDYLQADGAITEFLQERPMREIAAFADLVRRAREAAPDQGFAQWCEQAKNARGDHRKDVAQSVARLREVQQRALLVTVAMLHGAHADVIHRAAQVLLRIIGSASEQLPVLEDKDLSERFTEIAAASDTGGRVRFTDLDYDAAVRAHFWDHVPDLRPHLGIWTAQLMDLSDPHMTADVRSDLVARLAGQYLRTGRGEGLVLLAEGWSSTSASNLSRQAAVQALAWGLSDPRQGARLRNLIRHWCAERRLKGEFAQVLVQICAEVIAASHPDQALIRLYHLARREPDTDALHALSELVSGSRRLRRRLFDRLARYELTPATLTIFLRTCDPQALTGPSQAPGPLVREEDVQRSLTVCWHAVLSALPRTQWHPQVEHWLHSAASEEQVSGELLLDILVVAAQRCGSRRGSVFAALYASAREAERSTDADPKRAVATTELLLSKIRAVQGLGPTASATARGTRQ
ncbi:hypothetical protein AB0M29_31105 [Streptomyces sp. NPDC051976]|uniref:hypothetical protein n=1 Tax=Streptomyces sp. NPDC051976 TaxID=3154947 RepID=UPI00342BB6BD